MSNGVVLADDAVQQRRSILLVGHGDVDAFREESLHQSLTTDESRSDETKKDGYFLPTQLSGKERCHRSNESGGKYAVLRCSSYVIAFAMRVEPILKYVGTTSSSLHGYSLADITPDTNRTKQRHRSMCYFAVFTPSTNLFSTRI